MSDIHGTYQRASVLEAARLLGVSPTTVRRMVRAGTLRAERVLRPQGHTFVVLVPADSQPAASSSQQVSAEARTEVPPAEQFAAVAASILTPVLGPLIAELAASRQANERQADQLVSQAETIGELRAEIRALTASTVPQAVEPTTDIPLGRWRSWVPWLLGLLSIGAVVGLLVWPR
jgi:excisionase family DNA binding protein